MGKNYYLKDRDILDQALEHSWGKTADAKAKEKAYNREYYQRHKEEILRKARQAGEGIQRTAQNAYNDVRTALSNERRQASNPMDRNTIRPYARANEMNDRLYKEAKNRSNNAENRVQESNARAERFRKASNAEGRKYDSEVERAKALRADPRTSQLAVDARTEADAHLNKAADYQRMAREAGQETYNRINESNRARKNQRRMANRRMNSGAAYNEASKAAQRDDWGVYDKRFDSKLARDAQNAYSKARGTARKAKDAVDRYVDDALNYAKKLNKDAQLRGSTSSALNEMDKARKQNSPTERLKRDARRITKDARAGIDNAYNQARSGIENAYNQASRTAKNVKNDLETSKRTRQMKNLDTMLKAINKLPADKYEETRELTRKMRSANAQAYNQASKSRKEAKKRMKKWFGHSDYSYKKK